MDIVLIGAGRVAGAFAPFLMKMGRSQRTQLTKLGGKV